MKNVLAFLFLVLAAAIVSGCAAKTEMRAEEAFAPAVYASDTPAAPPMFAEVDHILVNTQARKLEVVFMGGEQKEYPIAVGREEAQWQGEAYIGRMQAWPTWTPPGSMIARKPELAQWAGGMPGGPENPLGAFALYLFGPDGTDTKFRIHGTNDPSSIGQAVSSGCIRMYNEDVLDLKNYVGVGTRVVVI